MNINNIIKKCITELKTEKPKIDYVLGMLETLEEMQPAPMPIVPATSVPVFGVNPLTPPPGTVRANTDEKAILDARAKAAIQEVKRLTEEGTNNA